MTKLPTSRSLNVVSLCNALVDVLVKAEEDDLHHFGLTKGVMHLVDTERQAEVLKYFSEQKHTVELGGSSMNAIRALAALGQKTAFAGVVGKDAFGKQIKDRINELGIRNNVWDVDADATGCCFILITPDGERTMVTALGASRHYDTAHVPVDDIKKAQILHVSGYQFDTDNQREAILSAIRLANDVGTLVSFDVADPFVVNRYQKEFIELIRSSADIVFANREESRLLFGTTGEEAAKHIADLDAIAVVKLGSEGALVRKGAEQWHIKPVPTDVVDTTAAGDMFAGGFLYGFSTGKTLPIAGQAGAMLASDVISRVGAILSPEALKRVRAL